MHINAREATSESEFVQILLEQYISYSAWLKTQPFSPHARRAQRSRLHQFIGFLSRSKRNYENTVSEQVTRDAAVNDYLDYLQYFLKARPSTVSKFLTTIGEFYEYLGVEPVSVEREDLPSLQPQALTEDQEDSFQRAAAANTSIKHRALALLMSTTGIRAIECTSLDLDDYTPSTGMLSVTATEQPTRMVELVPAAKTALDQWLDLRKQRFNRTNEKALFLNPQRRRMSQAGVNLVVRKISQEAGLDITAQQLRDTYLLKTLQSNTAKAESRTRLQSNLAAL